MNELISQNIEALDTWLMPDLMWDDFTNPDDELLKRITPGYTPYSQITYDQYDSPYGLTELRGLGGTPQTVKMAGFQRYVVNPGYWGESTTYDETQITVGREPGTLADPVAVSDWIGNFTLQFSTRAVSLMRKGIADTIRTGSFTNTGPNGQQFTYGISNYSSQIFAPNWSSSSANFITDLLGYKAGLQKGSSNHFGPKSVLLMNSASIVDLWKQTAIQATYKSDYGASLAGLDGAAMSEGLNAFLAGKNEAKQGFTLPKIVIYDFGYYNTLAAAQARDKSQFTYIIPTRSALWLGERPQGQIVGQFQLTRHAGLVEEGDAAKYPNADDAMDGEIVEGKKAFANGLYVRVHYHNRQPHHYYEEIGFNGSPVLGYPGAVAAINWS